MISIGTIEDVFDVGSSKRVFESQWTSSGVPFYRAREVVKLSKNGFIENELYISEEMYNEYKVKYGVPKAGDILVTGVGTLGICYQVQKHDRFYFKDGNIIWLKNKGNVDSSYIVYCFKSPFVRRQIESTADAAVVGTYTISNAKKTKIPLPPLEKQKKIAAILDAADAYRQKTKALIAKYDELTQALFLDMFGDPVKNEKGWEEIDLGSLIEITSSKRIFKDEYVENGVPFYRTKEIVELSKGNKISLELFISENRYYEIKQKFEIPEIGDILMSAVGTIGVMWTVDTQTPFYFKDGNLVWLKSSKLKSVNSQYLKRTLNYLIEHEKDKLAEGGAYNALTIAKLNKLKVLIAPLELQNQFAELVQAIEIQKAQAQASLVKAEELFNSLLHKAFKGELV
jgi:type I restriction enzyme S subunit